MGGNENTLQSVASADSGEYLPISLDLPKKTGIDHRMQDLSAGKSQKVQKQAPGLL